MDLVRVWYNDGYWSKTLWVTIPTPVYMTGVKVIDVKQLSLRMMSIGCYVDQSRRSRLTTSHDQLMFIGVGS